MSISSNGEEIYCVCGHPEKDHKQDHCWGIKQNAPLPYGSDRTSFLRENDICDCAEFRPK